MHSEKAHENSPAFLDKLGERLSFEQISIGLYDALSRKREGLLRSDCPLETIERFRQEELGHLMLLDRTLRQLGESPATPSTSAQLIATASQGLQKIVLSSNTSFADCLEAILIAELTDNSGWELLISLAQQAGHDNLAWEFQGALHEEQVHLSTLRSWIEDMALHDGEENYWVEKSA